MKQDKNIIQNADHMKIELFENERATNYDNFVNTWIPSYETFIELASNVIGLKTPSTENPQILIAGCGSGTEMLQMSRHYSHWQLTGVDPSPEMIEQATEKLAGHQNMHFINGLVSDLPPDQHFDGATLILVLHFMPNDGSKLTLLKDICERLKPGAPFYLVDIFGESDDFTTNLELLGALLKSKVDSTAMEARLNRIKEKIHHISEERLSALFEEAGFTPPTRLYQSTIYGSWCACKA